MSVAERLLPYTHLAHYLTVLPAGALPGRKKTDTKEEEKKENSFLSKGAVLECLFSSLSFFSPKKDPSGYLTPSLNRNLFAVEISQGPVCITALLCTLSAVCHVCTIVPLAAASS
jgi:hypothetical protein